MKTAALLLSLIAFASGASAQSTPGVTKNEIVIGSILDLSGPIAYGGKQVRNGMQMRLDEANANGGVNGRKIKLLVEDSAYDPKRSVLVAQKLVTGEHVFAIVGHMGTANNIAVMPMQFQNNVINFMPMTGTRAVFDPPERLKVAVIQPYYDQIELGVQVLASRSPQGRFCVAYQDDEYGLEHLRGTEAGLKTVGTTVAEKVSYKRGATDFSSQVARLKGAGCTHVVLGTLVRETIGIMSEAHKADFNPEFIGSESVYTGTMMQLGGKAVEGLYGVHAMTTPTAEDASRRVRDWYTSYKSRFGEDPQQLAVYGWYAMDLFIATAEKAGPTLTTDSFLDALESTTWPRNMFGGPEFHITKTNRLGSGMSRVSQIQNGKWVPITELRAAKKS